MCSSKCFSQLPVWNGFAHQSWNPENDYVENSCRHDHTDHGHQHGAFVDHDILLQLRGRMKTLKMIIELICRTNICLIIFHISYILNGHAYFVESSGKSGTGRLRRVMKTFH